MKHKYDIKNGTVRYNTDLLCKINKKRDICYSVEVKSGLIGLKIYDTKENRYLLIKRVYKEFFFGWFYKIVYETKNKSHGSLFWKESTEIPPIISKAIKKTRKRYIICSESPKW